MPVDSGTLELALSDAPFAGATLIERTRRRCTGLRQRRVATATPQSPAATQTTVTLVRGPYLQQVGANQAIVVWATREPGTARVEYRTGSGPLLVETAISTFRSSSATGIPNYYQHEATLTGLGANTTHVVRPAQRGRRPHARRRRSASDRAPPGTGTVRLVAFGDSGTGSSSQSRVATAIGNDTFDFAIHNGDVAYSRGTYAEFEARFFPFYRNWLRRKGIFPAIGNHDDMTSSATPYRTLLRAAARWCDDRLSEQRRAILQLRLRSGALHRARHAGGVPVGGAAAGAARLARGRPAGSAGSALAHRLLPPSSL